MQYIPCNSALLAQETLFLTEKGTFFAQNLNSRQNSVCLSFKFSSESILFGRCHPCSRATSATLVSCYFWETFGASAGMLNPCLTLVALVA